jgi:hypothetical protein
LSQRLEVVRDSAEWVIALHLLREPDRVAVAQASPTLQALQTELASSNPGRAHLLRRRIAEVERDEARRMVDEAATDVLAHLNDVAANIYREALPADTVERPLLRASILVHRQDESRFLDAVEGLRTRWAEPTYSLLLTGPWPPYRFGGIDAAETDDG